MANLRRDTIITTNCGYQKQKRKEKKKKKVFFQSIRSNQKKTKDNQLLH